MGKEADQATVAVLHPNVYHGDICEVFHNPASTEAAILVIGGSLTVIGGKGVLVHLMFLSQF